MKNRRSSIFTLLLLLWNTVNSACFGQSLQPFKFQSFTTQNGLPAPQINAFAEDANGFLWVATSDGISRFDGFQFKNYRLPVIDSTLISGSNLVLQVKCLQKQIWCLNFAGQFFRLDHLNDVWVFTGFSIPIELNRKNSFNLLDFLYDPNRNCIWVNDKNKLIQYNVVTDKILNSYHFEEKYLGIPLLDENGRLWCSMETGEVCFDPETKSKIVFFENLKFNVRCRQGSKIWYLTNGDTLYFIDTRTNLTGFVATNAGHFFKNQALKNATDVIFAPGISGDSLLWVSTFGDGLFVVNIFSSQYVAWFNTDSHENKGFLSDWVYKLFVSSDQCLWLGTQKGVLKIDGRQSHFVTQKALGSKKSQIFRIRQVLTSPVRRSEKWLATGDGLFLFDESKKEALQSFLLPYEKTENSDLWAKINYMKFDNADNLWLGTEAGMAKLDPSMRISRFSDKKSAVKGVSNFILLEKDAFWVRNNAGAGLYWPERRRYFPILFPPRKDGTSMSVHQLNQGLNQSALFSSESAIWRVKPSDFDPECACFPKPAIVWNVDWPDDLIENDTSIWVLLPNGLAELHKKNGTTRVFGEKEGLSNPRVRSILEGSDGQFWMNSDNGLFVFHPKYGRFKKYTEEDGLENNYIPGVLGRDNEYFHAGFSDAYTTFQPHAGLLKTNIKPYFTGVFALDQRLPVDFSAADLPAITVDYTRNILRFEFSCPDFYQSEKITFHYQLEGFDAARRFAGFSRSAVYTNLDGGNYRFLVWATNADGFPCEQPAVFSLRVVPPFYRTWWFYTFCFAAVGFLFYALFRYREIQRLRQEQLRLRIARDLHDEVGSTLSSISILSASALRGVEKDLDTARFGNIGEKARAALDSISDIVWSVNPENDSMEKALARMSTYASEMLENAGTELRFEVGEGVEVLTLPMEKRKDFYLIFKEAIHNCAKYARAKQVKVALRKEDNTLILSIKDDGVGFTIQNTEPEMSNMGSQNSKPKDQNSKPSLGGNGLRNMRSRAAAIGAEFQIKSAVGAGTVVLIKIPMKP